jgi:pyruvate formate lyase activating enzyme
LSQYGRVADASWAGEPAQPAEIVARAAAVGASVGLSYAEPGLAPELTLSLAEHAGPRGVPLVWKTNGFLTTAAVDMVAGALEAVNIDVKAADEGAHRRLTGAALRPVLDALERFRAAGVWVEVSTPLIPGVSAEPAALASIARHLAASTPTSHGTCSLHPGFPDAPPAAYVPRTRSPPRLPPAGRWPEVRLRRTGTRHRRASHPVPGL